MPATVNPSNDGLHSGVLFLLWLVLASLSLSLSVPLDLSVNSCWQGLARYALSLSSTLLRLVVARPSEVCPLSLSLVQGRYITIGVAAHTKDVLCRAIAVPVPPQSSPLVHVASDPCCCPDARRAPDRYQEEA